MSVNIYMILLLVFPKWIVAEDIVTKNPVVVEQIFIIISIMFGSVCATLGLMGATYLIIKFIKRKMSEPQYCIDDTVNNKDSNEYHQENYDVYPRILHINQIQPVLTVSHMASSIKQSFADLYISLIPFSWSRAQHVYNQSSSINEKKDLSI